MKRKSDNSINKHLKKQRVKAGITQLDLSKILGFKSKQIVSNWERGLCMPPKSTRKKLNELLKLDHKKIFDHAINETKEVWGIP